jgi:cytochrome P450
VPHEEGQAFPNWENAMLTGSTIEEVEDGGRQCYEFALRMIELKRRSSGNDLFSNLLRAHEEEGALDADELASTFIVLMVGAGEAANAIANGLLILLSIPEKIASIQRNSKSMMMLVDEVLRYESPFRLLPPRFSERPVQFDGVTIPAGELIVVSPASANRDPMHFPHPERFCPTEYSKDHLAFGDGYHKCPGAQFARMEIEEALRAFTDHLSEFRLLVPANQAHWRSGDFMRRLDELSVIYSPKAAA